MKGSRIVLAAMLSVSAVGAVAQNPYVVDGDTLDFEGDRIRLWGIVLQAEGRG